MDLAGSFQFLTMIGICYSLIGINYLNEYDKSNDNSIVNLMLNDNDYGLHCLNQLNGKIHIICGNHDTDTRAQLYDQCINVVEVCSVKELKIGKNYFWLCHYPTITANYDDNKPWAKHLINLYGHTHQKTKFYNDNPYMYCVCLDAHNNHPVELQTILTDIKNKKMQLDEK